MRALIAGSLLCVAMLSGCSGPDDAGAPAPNYNPATERDDYPEPSGSATRPAGSATRTSGAETNSAIETGEANAPPQPSEAPADDPVDPDSPPSPDASQ
jgi:hypothetical protein